MGEQIVDNIEQRHAKFGYSYPSKQKRQGPAPLASFEDLPTDDQYSDDCYSSDDERFHIDDLSPDEVTLNKVLTNACEALDSGSPTRTLTPEGLDFPSNTITPVSPDLTPRASLSPDSRSASRKDHLTPGHESYDKSPSPSSSRKGSWTNIFFKGKSRSKSPITPDKVEKTEKVEKKSFFSFFKIGRKSPAPSNDIIKTQTLNRTPRVSVTDTSENEPIEELILIPGNENETKELKQDIHKDENVSSTLDDLSKINVNINKRKLISRTETIDDECRSLPERLPSFVKTSLETKGTLENRSESIESDLADESRSSATLTLDDNKSTSKKECLTSEDETEAVTLLTQDSVDYEDFGAIEFQFANQNLITPKLSSFKLGRNNRNTDIISIDRPRSTTPINVASLEAFIKNVPKIGNSSERIKLTLPGGQFSSNERIKSPRKNDPQILLDFCEKGLKSARKKKEANEFLFPETDLLDGQEASLTPITPILDFEDNWTPFGNAFEVKLDGAFEERDSVTKECDKCECKKIRESKLFINNGESTGKGSDYNLNKDECTWDRFSKEECSCECHKWRQTSLQRQERVFSISSDISSASSRLIQGSSTSSSKCSLEQNEDKFVT